MQGSFNQKGLKKNAIIVTLCAERAYFLRASTIDRFDQRLSKYHILVCPPICSPQLWDNKREQGGVWRGGREQKLQFQGPIMGRRSATTWGLQVCHRRVSLCLAQVVLRTGGCLLKKWEPVSRTWRCGVQGAQPSVSVEKAQRSQNMSDALSSAR